MKTRIVIRSFIPIGSLRRAGLTALLAIAPGACATSVHLPPFVAEDYTGSIAAPPSPLSSALDQEDWRRAQAALGTALDPQGNGDPVSWSNPQTGARGSFTPVGDPYSRDDRICRAFLADLAGVPSPAKLQGTACRGGTGVWTPTDVRPWKS